MDYFKRYKVTFTHSYGHLVRGVMFHNWVRFISLNENQDLIEEIKKHYDKSFEENIKYKIDEIDENEYPLGKNVILDREMCDIIEDLRGTSQKIDNVVGLFTDWRCGEKDLTFEQSSAINAQLVKCECQDDEYQIWLSRQDDTKCFYCE